MTFLAAEPLIVARLIEACPSARAVLTARDVAEVMESSQVSPALQVYHDGWSIEEVIGMGDTSRVLEHWLVVAVVRHARQGGEAAAALREAAAPLVAEAYAALAGWRPSSELGWLRPVDPPRPVFSKSHGYFPLAFTTRFTVSGDLDP